MCAEWCFWLWSMHQITQQIDTTQICEMSDKVRDDFGVFWKGWIHIFVLQGSPPVIQLGMLKISWANGINNKCSFPNGWGLSGSKTVSPDAAISKPWKWIALVLTGEKLVCDSDCALFTLPAHGSCRGCLITWIEWLQMLGGKAWSRTETQSWRKRKALLDHNGRPLNTRRWLHVD